ncbi:CoA-binding protein [Campylobacter sp. faydin G-24]|uniref:CoA-binding protein n=1 Tax=Campylobacter anatolicus TaxID=2829105 RepID=A0ABS5HJ07_9BACT|nr:CoA-binding protein [Campylobacter anatolicus]MBR8464026.1 CoA-binding protein [Campylobacter anatolicus]MBR8465786.1 CoA-binding protein [Campylobacter anatolicus]
MQDKIEQILRTAKRIAVVGLSPDERKDSNMVARNLIEQGYEIYPVYPKFDEILSRKVYGNLCDIDDRIDIAVMFRKSEFADVLLDEVIKKGVKTLWLQLGIINENARKRAEQNGINFIQNRCIKIELQNLKR